MDNNYYTRTSRETAERPYKKRMECDQAKMISPPGGGVEDSYGKDRAKKTVERISARDAERQGRGTMHTGWVKRTETTFSCLDRTRLWGPYMRFGNVLDMDVGQTDL